jgi:hypothetical protein
VKKDTGYAMRAWLDLSKPMPARMLTIDDVLKGLLEQYQAMYGKPAPLDVATKYWRLVEEAKAEYSRQTRFLFMRKVMD